MPQPNFGPMEGFGAETDMLSGYPAEVERVGKTERNEQRQRERDTRIWRLLQDLRGPGGEVAQRLLGMAVERIHALSTTDPQLCMLFQALGEGVFAEIRQGDRFARETALELCATVLRLPSTPPRREPQDEER